MKADGDRHSQVRWRFVRGHDKPVHGSCWPSILSRWYNNPGVGRIWCNVGFSDCTFLLGDTVNSISYLLKDGSNKKADIPGICFWNSFFFMVILADFRCIFSVPTTPLQVERFFSDSKDAHPVNEKSMIWEGFSSWTEFKKRFGFLAQNPAKSMGFGGTTGTAFC